MEWSSIAPARPGFFWVVTETDFITIYRIPKKSKELKIVGFGLTALSPDRAKFWGEEVIVSEHCFMNSPPEDDGWFVAKFKDGRITPIRVARGGVLHCYDFESENEISIEGVVAWNGPLRPPAAPKPSVTGR